MSRLVSRLVTPVGTLSAYCADGKQLGRDRLPTRSETDAQTMMAALGMASSPRKIGSLHLQGPGSCSRSNAGTWLLVEDGRLTPGCHLHPEPHHGAYWRSTPYSEFSATLSCKTCDEVIPWSGPWEPGPDWLEAALSDRFPTYDPLTVQVWANELHEARGKLLEEITRILEKRAWPWTRKR